jgi:ubiquinol-cytochrome c reductase cytochrome b/c1 subunit
MGAKPPEGIYTLTSQICTVLYFAFFLVVLPLLTRFEKTLPLPASIHEAILADKKA